LAKKKDDTQYLYNIPLLNMVFALVSVALLLSIVLMFADDYIREWRQYQREFRSIEIENANIELSAKISELDSTQLIAIETKISDAELLVVEREEEIASAQDNLNSLEDDWYMIDQKYRFAKSEYDAKKYSYEVRLKENLIPEAEQLKIEMDNYNSIMFNSRNEIELNELEKEKANSVLSKLNIELSDSKNELDKLNSDITKIELFLSEVGPSFANDYFRNMPMLDFINPSEKVIQVVVADLHEDLNFLTVPRVDRCQTCHLAIDKPGFEDAEQPYTTHPNLSIYVDRRSPHPLSDFGCTTCHGGLGRSVTFKDTYHTPSSEEQKEEWIEKYNWVEPHYWDYPMYRANLIEASCFKCHKQQAEVVGAEVLNAGVDLIKRLGCFGCHKIEGFTELRKVGPNLSKISSKVSKEWTYKWVKNPKHFQSKTRMPRFFDLLNSSTPEDMSSNDVQARAIVDYIFANSQKDSYRRVPRRGNVNRGEALIENLGCLGCHKLGDTYKTNDKILSRREFGPNLNGLGSKLNNGWLFHWLKNPQQYFPETVMPQLRLSDQEAADISSYLLSINNEEFDNISLPIENEETLNELTFEYLKRNMIRSEADAKLNSMNSIEKSEFVGEKLIGRYGCFGCHIIPGFENAQQIGTDLTEEGSKIIARFDFGFIDIEHTKEEWIFNKVKTPRIFDNGKMKQFDEKLKMPNFGLSNEKTNAVLTAIMGFTKENVASTKMRNLDSHEIKVHEGLRLIQERNCRGCHVIENEGGAIIPVINTVMMKSGFTEEEAVSFSPPNLHGEGEKVQPDWLFRFVKDPSEIRPWLKVRMPTFNLSNEDALTIEQFFTHASRQDFPYRYTEKTKLSGKILRDAQMLVSDDYFACFSCHQQGAEKPEGPVTDWAPDLALAGDRLRPEWIPKWIRNPNLIQPGTKMPTFFDPEYFDESGPDDILEGDEEKQIQVMTDYILQLGE